MNSPANNRHLVLQRLGIDTYRENILYLRGDSHVWRAEGFRSLTRVEVSHNGRTIIATLNEVRSDLLRKGEASLSEEAFDRLGVAEGDTITVDHLDPILSLRHVRAKVYGKTLDAAAYHEVIGDISRGRYSSVHLAAFIAGCAGRSMTMDEIIALTRAMIDSGERISWIAPMVMDKHSIGGLPGNRTTPIVVPIVAACGLTIPKTSSRAITSPAGTADVMETMTNVTLSLDLMRRVVEQHGGCLAWGGSAALSPADDILIRVERVLDLDSEAQLVASVLSKKAAAGSTHVLIEMPMGPTAKVRDAESAGFLSNTFHTVAEAIGLRVKVLTTDGLQPVGRAIGPALEARDVLAVLRGTPGAPDDLRTKALNIAREIMMLAGFHPAEATQRASDALASGDAYAKFLAICEAQGGFREPVVGSYTRDVVARTSGVVTAIDNRMLALCAKLAGAPLDKGAGLVFLAPLGTHVETGQILYTVYAESEGELHYAAEHLAARDHLVTITPQ
jgi:thymidine phosphorylase